MIICDRCRGMPAEPVNVPLVSTKGENGAHTRDLCAGCVSHLSTMLNDFNKPLQEKVMYEYDAAKNELRRRFNKELG